MTLPLLAYPLSSQNQRVNGFIVPGDETARLYTLDTLPKQSAMDEVIWAAYRQIFNEQQILTSYRQTALESQLRAGQINVREFVRGLVLSDSFRRLNYESNTNYRFVDMCIQRLLGRNIYDQRETFAWSTVLATQGLQGFVDALLNSDDYINRFGDTTVPYQQRRILPQRSLGELPFARMARYDSYHRQQLQALGQLRSLGATVTDASAAVYRQVLFAVPLLALLVLVATLIAVAAP
jgi:phycobilisome rod-core linker protein